MLQRASAREGPSSAPKWLSNCPKEPSERPKGPPERPKGPPEHSKGLPERSKGPRPKPWPEGPTSWMGPSGQRGPLTPRWGHGPPAKPAALCNAPATDLSDSSAPFPDVCRFRRLYSVSESVYSVWLHPIVIAIKFYLGEYSPMAKLPPPQQLSLRTSNRAAPSHSLSTPRPASADPFWSSQDGGRR